MLPPDIAKLLPKNRLLSEVYILLPFYLYLYWVWFEHFFCWLAAVYYQASTACTRALHTSSTIAQLWNSRDKWTAFKIGHLKRPRPQIYFFRRFWDRVVATGRMAWNRSPAITRVGALRYSSTWAPHYALPETSELPAKPTAHCHHCSAGGHEGLKIFTL